MTAQLRIAERCVGDVTVLDLAGRLEVADGDIEFVSAVDALLAAGRAKIVVNLRDVVRIDSGGIGVLVAKYVSAQKRGGDLKLLHLTPHTHRPLAVTRLLTVLESYDDEGAAIAGFARGGAAREVG